MRTARVYEAPAVFSFFILPIGIFFCSRFDFSRIRVYIVLKNGRRSAAERITNRG